MRILRLYLQVASRWRWGLLLVLILATLLVEPFLGQGPGPELLTRILFALIVLGAMVAGRVPARARHANFVILGIWLVLVLLHFAGRPYPQAMAFSALVLLFGVIYITFHFLITHRESNVDAMVGAAAGYFLLALAWAVLFIQIENRTPGSFGLDTVGRSGRPADLFQPGDGHHAGLWRHCAGLRPGAHPDGNRGRLGDAVYRDPDRQHRRPLPAAARPGRGRPANARGDRRWTLTQGPACAGWNRLSSTW